MLQWYFQATKLKIIKTIFKLKKHFLRNFLTANLIVVKKSILKLNHCFGHHMLVSVSCTKREESIKHNTWKETVIETTLETRS